MRRRWVLASGALLLAGVWLWPLPHLGVPPFSAHMTMHMAVVAIAAPLLALGIAGSKWDPVPRWPVLFAAVPASIVELVAVWGWHAPALHHAARTQVWAFALEQGTFLFAGLFLWVAAFGGGEERRRSRALGGITGLLLTAMHMTLLGALLGLTTRELYGHREAHAHGALTPLLDQQLGGAIMILIGGASYLVGGVALVAEVLRSRQPSEGRP